VLVVLYKVLFVLFYLFLFSLLTLNFVGLPGNWILVATALIVLLVPGFSDLSWSQFAIVCGLAVLGEIIESLLGLVVVAKKGGTRWGVLGSFLGGIGGAILGSAIVPLVGTVIFGLIGAFAGAVVGEYLRERRGNAALWIGFWAFVGRSLAMLGKAAVGAGIIWILISSTWK